MINFVRFGICFFIALLLTASLQGQDDSVKSVSERLDEVRLSIDEAYANIATLQQSLNNATDAEDQSRIGKLREEIDLVWIEVDRLKELEDMLQVLKDKSDSDGDSRPRGGTPRGGNGFGRDTSTGQGRERERGFMNEDGSSGDEYHKDSSTGDERPKRAIPGDQDQEDGQADEPRRPRPPARERPQRGLGPGAPNDGIRNAKQPVAPLTSEKLRQLETSYKSLVEAGELDLADQVMESIKVEKKRLADERRENEKEESRNQPGQKERPPHGKRQPGGGGLVDMEPANPAPAAGKSKEDLIREFEELVKQLQDENKELREQVEKDEKEAADKNGQ